MRRKNFWVQCYLNYKRLFYDLKVFVKTLDLGKMFFLINQDNEKDLDYHTCVRRYSTDEFRRCVMLRSCKNNFWPAYESITLTNNNEIVEHLFTIDISFWTQVAVKEGTYFFCCCIPHATFSGSPQAMNDRDRYKNS